MLGNIKIRGNVKIAIKLNYGLFFLLADYLSLKLTSKKIVKLVKMMTKDYNHL